MLFSVFGSSHRRVPRALARWVRIAVVGAASLSAFLPTRAALAQAADDNGWFDEPGADQPYDAEPDANGDPTPTPQSDVDDTDPSALTTFRPALDPYGAWVSDSTYGTVWVPSRDVVGADFAPYVSRGHWALTADDDWIWVSDYPFGWATFHYGRWVWISGSGWAWVPGRRYANAWVVWRVPTAEYAYVGWAPMPPTWGYWNGYAFGIWYSPPLPYVFCPSAYVFDYRVHYHIVHDRRLVRDIAGHTRVYPTPYRAPAAPSRHVASAPGVRPAAVAPARVPHGPAMSAARVPAQAVPAVRTAPPPNALRVSARRTTADDFSRSRASSSSDPRVRSSSSPRVPPSARESFRRDDVPRSPPSPSSSWSNPPRADAPTRSRVEPRSSAPTRTRIEPRNVAPAPRNAPAPRIRVAPSTSHSFAPAPSRSTPSFPRMHSGGSFRRR